MRRSLTEVAAELLDVAKGVVHGVCADCKKHGRVLALPAAGHMPAEPPRCQGCRDKRVDAMAKHEETSMPYHEH